MQLKALILIHLLLRIDKQLIASVEVNAKQTNLDTDTEKHICFSLYPIDKNHYFHGQVNDNQQIQNSYHKQWNIDYPQQFQGTIIYYIKHPQAKVIAQLENLSLFPDNIKSVTLYIDQQIVKYSIAIQNESLTSFIVDRNQVLKYTLVVQKINMQTFIYNHQISMLDYFNLQQISISNKQWLAKLNDSRNQNQFKMFIFSAKDPNLQNNQFFSNYLQECSAFNYYSLNRLPIIISIELTNTFQSLEIDESNNISVFSNISILIDYTNCQIKKNNLQILNMFNRIILFGVHNQLKGIQIRAQEIYIIDFTIKTAQTIKIEAEYLFICKLQFIRSFIHINVFELLIEQNDDKLTIEMNDIQIIESQFNDNNFIYTNVSDNKELVLYLSSTIINNSYFKNFSLLYNSRQSNIIIRDVYISNSVIESSNFIVFNEIYINNLSICNCTITDSTFIKGEYLNLKNINISNSKLIRVNILETNLIQANQLIISHTQLIDSTFLNIQNQSMQQVTEVIGSIQYQQLINFLIYNSTYYCQSPLSFIKIQAYFILIEQFQITNSSFSNQLLHLHARQIFLNYFEFTQSSIVSLDLVFIHVKSQYIDLFQVSIDNVILYNCSAMITLESVSDQSICNITQLQIMQLRMPNQQSIIYVQFNFICLQNIILTQEFNQIHLPIFYLYGQSINIINLNYHSSSDQSVFIIFADKFLLESSTIMNNQSNYFCTINSLTSIIINCKFTESTYLFEFINTVDNSSILHFHNNSITSTSQGTQQLEQQPMIKIQGKFQLVNIANNIFNINVGTHSIFKIINVYQLLIYNNKARIPQNFIQAATLFQNSSMTCIYNEFTQSQQPIIYKQCTLIQFNFRYQIFKVFSNVTIKYLNVNLMACNILHLIDSWSIQLENMVLNKVKSDFSGRSLIDIHLSYFIEVQIKIYHSNFTNLSLIQDNLSINKGLISIDQMTNISIEFYKISIRSITSQVERYHLIDLKSNEFLAINISDLSVINSQCGHSCLSIIVVNLSKEYQVTNHQFYLIENTNIYNNSGTFVMRLGNLNIKITNTTILTRTNQQLLDAFLANINLQYSELYCDLRCAQMVQLAEVHKTFVSTIETIQQNDFTLNQLRFSINQGRSFLHNKIIKLNTYLIQYFNSKNQFFYVPNGQYFHTYQRLNFSNFSFSPYNLDLYFQFVDSFNIIQNLSCSMLIKQNQTGDIIQSINFSTLDQQWDNLSIITPRETIISFNIKCQLKWIQQELTFYVKPFPCQMGEYQLKHKCLRCSEIKQHYSVKKESQICKVIDPETTIYVNSAFIKLRQGYWRPYFNNDEIERCNSRWSNCNGGLDVGDKICSKGYIGAICSECDLFDFRGQGKFVKSNSQGCIECRFQWKDLYKLAFILLLQLYIFY